MSLNRTSYSICCLGVIKTFKTNFLSTINKRVYEISEALKTKYSQRLALYTKEKYRKNILQRIVSTHETFSGTLTASREIRELIQSQMSTKKSIKSPCGTGKQRIITPDGYIIPLDVVDGLPYCRIISASLLASL